MTIATYETIAEKNQRLREIRDMLLKRNIEESKKIHPDNRDMCQAFYSNGILDFYNEEVVK